MVQTYQSPVRIYKYPFELIMVAYEKRFPTCPQIPIFVGSEILSTFRSPDNAIEIIERKCQLKVEAPYLVKKITGDFIYFKQKNSLDRRKRTLLIEATNISFYNRIVVQENCNYYVHSDNENWTCFEQNASLDVKSFFGFESSVEKIAVKQYVANLSKGKEILEHFIEELLASGVIHVPRFTDTIPIDSQNNLANKNNCNSFLLESSVDVSDIKKKNDISNINQCQFNDQLTKTTLPKKDNVIDNVSFDQENKHYNSLNILKETKKQGIDFSDKNCNTDVKFSTSFDKNSENLKLEAEYIQRFLGQLTPLEESRLCELKYGLSAAHKGKMPNDAHLLRFLRARDFDVQKARDMIITSLLWRKQHNVDKILNEFVPPPVLIEYFPGCWHHSDLEGRPLFVLRLGQLDIKGILRAVGLETVVKFTLSICEEGLLNAAEATHQLGKPISTWTLLIDLEGLSLRHLWRPGVQSLLRIIETVEAHYPETMGLVLITRAPRVFPVLWTLISPFINENTRKKFMIHNSENFASELLKYIDKDYLPDFLGGPAKFEANKNKINKSWLVPKSEYKKINMDELLRESEEEILTSTYVSAVINKNVPHEVFVNVSTAGCVLTWDFDVIKNDCEFTIYHTSKFLNPSNNPHSATSSLSPVEFVTSTFGANLSRNGNAFVIYAYPELRIGNDLQIAERTVTFAEGDSMQGSYYCSLSGTYIMQWRISDQLQNSYSTAVNSNNLTANISNQEPLTRTTNNTIFNETSFLGGSGHNKCKIMYYQQLLNSADFKGSVASLQSCRSSFSSLTAAVALSTSTTSNTLHGVMKNVDVTKKQ